MKLKLLERAHQMANEARDLSNLDELLHRLYLHHKSMAKNPKVDGGLSPQCHKELSDKIGEFIL